MSTTHDLSSVASADDAALAGSAHAIADRIASSISLGMLSVGERLPPEVDLAGQLGVAVATLRKGLAVLRERELVVTHRGRSGGTFVVKAPFPTSTESQQRLRELTVVDLRDIRDEHIAIGVAVTRFAAERSWPGSLARLNDLAAAIAEAPDATIAASVDSRFHIELAVLSQSSRLLNAELRLQSETSPMLWTHAAWAPCVADVHEHHTLIAQAVASGDAERAAHAMREHITRDSRRIIEAKLAIDASPQ